MENSFIINWIYIGKIVLTAMAFILSICGVYVLFKFRRWHSDLIQLEHTAQLLRDDAMFNMTAYRASLVKIKQRIEQTENKLTSTGSVVSNKFVIDSAMSVLKLLMQKERSILQWGSVGMKLAKSAFDYFRKG